MELIELVRRAQQGDEQAFTAICRRFAGLVKKHANQPHMKPLGEDAEAEAWLAVVRAVKTYRPEMGVQVAGYVESQVKYTLWNLFKRERKRWQRETALAKSADDEGASLLDFLAAAADVPGEVEARSAAAEIRRALAELPARQRQAVILTLAGGQRLAEAASGMGVSPQAVFNLRSRGLARLRTLCRDLV
ncbi:MAG: RNA polymerase sigma factor [Negativicutes bacterium]|nr:RNA polymerase sigma factor [Negativicutes bacterium]